MFEPVNNKVEFPKMEEDVLKLWSEKDIYKKSIEQRPADNEYVFYDGPPFATGLPHFGHFVPGTIKDAIPRYQSMKGKRVIRRFGWDCHGLPVESEMEKTIGVSGHRNIVEYGVGKFNEECRSIVLRYTAEWKKAITRMGRWVDFDNGYRTMDKNYMESVWWAFKTLYDKGLIYEGYNVLPYSPKLASPLSNMEVNLGGYKDVTDQAVTVRFKVDGEENSYFLAWTTTPWTLPSNLALAVGPDIDYVKVKDDESGEYYYLAEKLTKKYYKDNKGMTVVARVKGNDLVGKTYEPLFPYFADLKTLGAFQVLTADYVTVEDGCGIVHTASGFGVDDYNTMKKLPEVPVVCPIDEECRFTSEVPEYEGMFVKDADKPIIQRLKEEGKLVKRENYLHSYPFCYRTGMPLIYRAMSCWFVDVPRIKSEMLKANDQITWVPEHIKYGRFGKWLEGAREWAISRNRFWGNPIPVWKCDGSDYIEVIGSVAELEAKCGQKVEDLHKHFVDQLTWPSPDGKGTMRRVPDILDCWFESGSMPYAQQHYPFENKEKFEKELFPADFINEGLDQTRGWFYSLTVLSTALFNKPAFENCIVSGIVLAEDGRKMSKSLRNYTDPMLVVEKYGADALRFALLNSSLVKADDLKFSEDLVKDVIKDLLLPLWNAYSFFVTYANIDGYTPSETTFEDLSNSLDRWIISDLEKLVKDETDAYESYDMQKAASSLVAFLDDLNNWYIRRSRRRFWRSENDGDKKQAYDTLYRVLMTFVKLACPIVPFVTETIYQNLKTEGEPESVHLCNYPEYNANERDEVLEKEMRLIVKAIEMGRSLRSASNLKIRQPLKKYVIVDRNSQDRDILERNKDIVSEELNVKDVEIKGNESSLVSYSAKANFKVLGSKLGKNMKEVAAKIQSFVDAEIASILEGRKTKVEYSSGEIELGEDDLVVQRTEKENVKVLNDGELTVGFDTEISEDLLLEGIARDLIRFVQTARKDSGFDVSDHITLTVFGTDVFNKAVEKFSSYIKSETLSDELTIAENNGIEGEIGEDKFHAEVKKV